MGTRIGDPRHSPRSPPSTGGDEIWSPLRRRPIACGVRAHGATASSRSRRCRLQIHRGARDGYGCDENVRCCRCIATIVIARTTHRRSRTTSAAARGDDRVGGDERARCLLGRISRDLVITVTGLSCRRLDWGTRLGKRIGGHDRSAAAARCRPWHRPVRLAIAETRSTGKSP